ncbi:uncharacterized protein A4U43_C01F19960 [Asparagus officinalis]|uniref:SWIM-type domain-containing protein n=1 Tax=Asparagus officinalis TaxID=4686 RepID=A0A5P1FUF1_ASPOF|nr:uncharacterized protein LOC109826137 [Asparagus officinalis]ONK80629.1 uncharacterized protein A4U43_C01F19960 [Asparagus officinalis]
MTMMADTVVAIVQSGGEFVTKDDGTMSYTGGEAHAVSIKRDILLDDLQSEIAKNMFSIELSTMSIKYFLPFNKRTLITVANDKDLERMMEFHVNSLTIDIYVLNKNDNRVIRNAAADSGTSTVETAAAADRSQPRRPTAAKNKRATRDMTSVADSSTPKGATSAVADNTRNRRQRTTDRVTIRIVPDDPGPPVVSTSTIDINRQERLEPDALDNVDMNSEIMNIINDAVPLSATNGDYIVPQESSGPWDSITMDVGQEFENVRTFRDELCKYAFAKGFKYRFVKNEHTRVTAKCISENCSWRIHASRSSRKQMFLIKKMNNVHTCGVLTGEATQPGQPRAKKQWLASIIREKVLENPGTRPKDIARDLYNEYGISLSYCQVWHAKETAQKEIHMLQEEACNQLPWLCEQIMSTNPGSVSMITSTLDAKIRRCFISLYASLHGFEHGCRPLLFVEKICLKINNQWKVLVAATLDGNDEIFPVAFAIVEDETPDSWHWFLVQLKYAITTYHKITIVSTRRKGLDDLLPKIFVDSYHSFSLSHLIQDLKAELKKGPWSDQVKEAIIDSFKGAAQAYVIEDFNAYIERISNISKDVATWIMSTKPEHWANAIFPGVRYDHLSSELLEPLCKWISMKDEGSAVQIMHALLSKTIEIIQSRQQASSTIDSTLTPTLEKKLQKETSKSKTLNVVCSTETMFEVRSTTVNVVNIGSWECTCKKWQITGLPCSHAVSVFNRVDKSAYDYCSRYFRKESYLMTYSEPVNKLPDANEMKFFVPASSYPPPTNRPPGRPKRKRINPYKTSIRPLKCSRCKVVGHNKATCEALL